MSYQRATAASPTGTHPNEASRNRPSSLYMLYDNGHDSNGLGATFPTYIRVIEPSVVTPHQHELLVHVPVQVPYHSRPNESATTEHRSSSDIPVLASAPVRVHSFEPSAYIRPFKASAAMAEQQHEIPASHSSSHNLFYEPSAQAGGNVMPVHLTPIHSPSYRDITSTSTIQQRELPVPPYSQSFVQQPTTRTSRPASVISPISSETTPLDAYDSKSRLNPVPTSPHIPSTPLSDLLDNIRGHHISESRVWNGKGTSSNSSPRKIEDRLAALEALVSKTLPSESGHRQTTPATFDGSGDTISFMMSSLGSVSQEEAFDVLCLRINNCISWIKEQRASMRNEARDRCVEHAIKLCLVMAMLYYRLPTM